MRRGENKPKTRKGTQPGEEKKKVSEGGKDEKVKHLERIFAGGRI